jgi:manganese efflux pump family protein
VCTAYAYRAIQRHEVVAAVPAACGGLSRAQVNQAVSTAIREAAGSGPKSMSRTQAASAEPWVKVLLTGPVPATGGAPTATSPGGGPGSILGPGTELAVKIAALLAWLITAASGGYVLVHWLRAGGRLRRRAATAVPPVVVLGHAGLGLLGLVLWTVFTATGWVAVAWGAAGILAPVAGLGMSVLVIGLPSPRPGAGGAAPAPPEPAEPVPAGTAGTAVLVAPPAPAAPAPSRSGGRQPILVIALHGLFAATVLALVLTAAVGAG